jgi:hypothetical protein
LTVIKNENSNRPGNQEEVARNGLEEFKEVMADFRSLTSLATKGAVAVPFADLVLRQFDTGISPPWPPGILIITSIAELLTLIFVFNFFFKSTRKALNKLMLALITVLCLSFVGYLYLFSTYTEKHPKTKQAVILGYEPVNNDIKQAFAEGYTVNQMLEENEFAPEKIWTQNSITIIRIVILLVWLVVFVSFSSFVASFVMLQRRPTR